MHEWMVGSVDGGRMVCVMLLLPLMGNNQHVPRAPGVICLHIT